MNIANKPGLYSLILTSHKPEEKAFKFGLFIANECRGVGWRCNVGYHVIKRDKISPFPHNKELII